MSDLERCQQLKDYRNRYGPPLTDDELSALRRGDIDAFENAAFDASWSEYEDVCVEKHLANLTWPDELGGRQRGE